jgi:hypothetical protein
MMDTLGGLTSAFPLHRSVTSELSKPVTVVGASAVPCRLTKVTEKKRDGCRTSTLVSVDV